MDDKETISDISYATCVESPVSAKKFSVLFQPSDYLPAEEDLWKLIAILGEQAFEKALTENQSIVNAAFIRNSFKKSGQYFYLYSEGKKMFSSFSQRIESRYGKLPRIALQKVLDYLNVNGIETLIEKGEISY